MFNLTGSVVLTLLFCLVCGGLCGTLNGVLVGAAKMPSFIVTLATMLILRSLSQYFCQQLGAELTGGGNSLFKMSREFASYDSLYGFGNGKLLTIPNVGWLLIVFTALCVYLSTSTKFGKKLYAIGSNEKAARLAGIQVSMNRTAVFGISGILAGLGAFLWIAMNGSCDPATTGSSFEMYAIAAVVLGGISMSGGKGRTVGILFGALGYTIIDKIIVALKMGLVTAKLEETAAHVVALSILLLNLRKIQCAFLQFGDWLVDFLQPCEIMMVIQ